MPSKRNRVILDRSRSARTRWRIDKQTLSDLLCESKQTITQLARSQAIGKTLHEKRDWGKHGLDAHYGQPVRTGAY